MQAVALKSLCDQDWKTQLAQGYPNIPKGDIVEIINPEYNNLYGTWCEVEYKGIRYYVDKKDLATNPDDIKEVLDDLVDYKQIIDEKFEENTNVRF